MLSAYVPDINGNRRFYNLGKAVAKLENQDRFNSCSLSVSALQGITHHMSVWDPVREPAACASLLRPGLHPPAAVGSLVPPPTANCAAGLGGIHHD